MPPCIVRCSTAVPSPMNQVCLGWWTSSNSYMRLLKGLRRVCTTALSTPFVRICDQITYGVGEAMDKLAHKVAWRFQAALACQEGRVAVAPEDWEGTVKEMKKDDDIDNPWALAWWMKNKGYTPHK